jgi:hypothetical protein
VWQDGDWNTSLEQNGLVLAQRHSDRCLASRLQGLKKARLSVGRRQRSGNRVWGEGNVRIQRRQKGRKRTKGKRWKEIEREMEISFLPFYIAGRYHPQHINHLDKLWYGSSTVSYSDLTEELNFILVTPIQIVLCQDRNLISIIFPLEKKHKCKNVGAWRKLVILQVSLSSFSLR